MSLSKGRHDTTWEHHKAIGNPPCRDFSLQIVAGLCSACGKFHLMGAVPFTERGEGSRLGARLETVFMQRLFADDQRKPDPEAPPASSRSTRVLAFIGSAVICWIVIKCACLVAASAWDVGWIADVRVRGGLTALVALAMTVVLSRIEGTIWGRYYVIVGYLFSLGLVIWIVLRLLHYV
jgi:hypothetical protein